AWPRGSELGLPPGQLIHLHGDGKLSFELFDSDWRHVASLPSGAELHVEKLHQAGCRHLVLVARNRGPSSVTLGSESVSPRFELPGSYLSVALTIDLAERRLRFLDLRITRRELERVGGYRAALAHAGRDFADLAAIGARPTMWDIACIHATARANVIYVRER